MTSSHTGTNRQKHPDGTEARYQRKITSDTIVRDTQIAERDLANKSSASYTIPDNKQLQSTFDYLLDLLAPYIDLTIRPRIRQCEVVDCHTKYHASGMCRYHYDQARRHTHNYIGYDERRRRGERNPRKLDKLRKVQRGQDAKLIHVDSLPDDETMRYSFFRDDYLVEENFHIPSPPDPTSQLAKQTAMIQSGIYSCYNTIFAKYPYIDTTSKHTYSKLQSFLTIIHSNLQWHLFCHVKDVIDSHDYANGTNRPTSPDVLAAVLLCYKDGFKEE